MLLYKSHAQIYILETPLIRGRPLQCSSKTQHPLLYQCCAPASSLAEQTQGKHPSNKDNHCCDSFEFTALSINSSSFTEWPLYSCEVEVQHRRCLVAVLSTWECIRPFGRQATHMWAADNTKPKTVVLVGSMFTPNVWSQWENSDLQHAQSHYQRGKTWPLSCPALHSLHEWAGCRGSCCTGAGVWVPCSPAHCCDIRVWSAAGKTVNKFTLFLSHSN